MPEPLEASQYDLPAGVSLDVLHFDFATAAQSPLRVSLRDQLATSRQLQKEWSSRFDGIYHQALRDDWDAPFLLRQVSFLLEKQRAALELLYPVIQELRESIAAQRSRLDAEVLELLRANADLAFGWITPYQALSDKLLALASERWFPDGKVLSAKPVEGRVDHEALTRKIIARFPGILAALAK